MLYQNVYAMGKPENALSLEM